MKRCEILHNYTVNEHGTIKSPGKFEGEPIYLPHFYDAMMDGGGDETIYEDDTAIEVFTITDEDRKEFPEIGSTVVLWLWETDQGFASRREFDSVEDAAKAEEEIEQAGAVEEDDSDEGANEGNPSSEIIETLDVDGRKIEVHELRTGDDVDGYDIYDESDPDGESLNLGDMFTERPTVESLRRYFENGPELP